MQLGEEQYETADSEQSEGVAGRGGRKRKMPGGRDRDSGLGSLHSSLPSSRPTTKLSRLPGSPSLSDHEYCDAASEPPASPQPRGEQAYAELRRHSARRYRSIITDIFDGALVSSVKCLTCDTVSKTAETFQDLSLPIPTPEAVGTVQSQGQGWGSWVWEWVASKSHWGQTLTC